MIFRYILVKNWRYKDPIFDNKDMKKLFLLTVISVASLLTSFAQTKGESVFTDNFRKNDTIVFRLEKRGTDEPHEVQKVRMVVREINGNDSQIEFQTLAYSQTQPASSQEKTGG